LFCFCADINHRWTSVIPHHTLQLEISDIEAESRAGEEYEEEEETVVLDPEHVCIPNLFFFPKQCIFHIFNTFSNAPCSLAFNEKIPVCIEKKPQQSGGEIAP